MGVTLRIIGGPKQGEQFAFQRHETFIVGRRHATISIPEDGFLSRNHFLIEVDPPRCLLKDLGSRNGTLVNGLRVADAILHDGDRIRAGRSEFLVTIDATFSEIPRVPCLRCRKVYAPADVIAATRPGEGTLEWVCETCKALARRYPRPPAGYWIEKRLGGGGMGEVYLARRASDRQPVAIKMMIPTGAAGDRAKRYFLRELEVLRDLRHPNIVAFYETVEIDGQFQLVMEYVDGPNAREWVRQLEPGPLPVRTAASIGVQLLAALEHAHGKGYVHRDIKPSNLLVAGPPSEPVVKLSDFGLAKSFRDNAGFQGLTHQGDIGGSVGFISPDHIREFSNVKEPADIYSTGATLYYLMTGKYPFLGFDPMRNDAYTMILEHPPVPIRAHRPDVPEGFDRVLRKALQKKPKDRWRSAAEMAAALRPYLEGTDEDIQP
jgi:serine/threonine-protein kinase